MGTNTEFYSNGYIRYSDSKVHNQMTAKTPYSVFVQHRYNFRILPFTKIIIRRWIVVLLFSMYVMLS